MFKNVMRFIFLFLFLFTSGYSIENYQKKEVFKIPSFDNFKIKNNIELQLKKNIFETKYLKANTELFFKDKSKQEYIFLFNFKIKNNYHLNSNQPLQDFLIPTTLTLNSLKFSNNINIKKTIYPKYSIRKIRNIPTTLYEGNKLFSIAIFFNLKSKTNINNIDFNFTYQPCTDQICYQSETISNKVLTTSNNLTIISEKRLSNILKETFKSSNNIKINKPQSLLVTLFFAFLSGLILNITPCVLPLISLKIINLINYKEYNNKTKNTNILNFLIGIWLAFLSIAFIVILLKNSGEKIGWGFQFQNPYYLVFLIIILLIFILNTIELYPFKLFLNINVTNLNKKTYWSKIVTGFISSLFAMTCTAPFMGVYIAYAFSQNNYVILLLFIFIALGFSSPFWMTFLLGNKILNYIPKLNLFKSNIFIFAGKLLIILTLITTIIWLIFVLKNLTSKELVTYFSLLVFTNIFILLLLFIFKKYLNRYYNKPLITSTISFLQLFIFPITVLFFVFNVNFQYLPSNANIQLSNDFSKILNSSSSKINWINFNQKSLQNILKSNKLTYVHITADWCLNCKVNEKFVLEREKTLNLFKQYNITFLKGDWTRKNNFIFSYIQQMGRVGIPLDVIYFTQNEEKKYHILNEFLTFKEIKLTLEKHKLTN